MLILLLILSLFIGIISSVFLLIEEGGTGKVIVIIVCIIVFVISIIGICNLSQKNTEWRDVWSTKIIALKDNSNINGAISGNIFVTSGYLNETLYYYCMEDTDEGKHMIKIPSDKTYIIEDNTETPRVVIRNQYWVDDSNNFWLDDFDKQKYYIYVPQNTIDKSYRINME